MEHCVHSLTNTERKRLVLFFNILAEDLLDDLAEDLVDSPVRFLAESSANLVEFVGSFVAVVVECLLWVLSC